MSRKAYDLSVSYSFIDGIFPSTILQKIQLASCDILATFRSSVRVGLRILGERAQKGCRASSGPACCTSVRISRDIRSLSCLGSEGGRYGADRVLDATDADGCGERAGASG